ncbi:MAG: DUF4340 domain-containing protein [Desulfosudis oleivorans]|nr:DUF4340 domain-containing protein [Desulfosudis oleivorans]
MLETLAGLSLTALVAESKNYALYELDDGPQGHTSRPGRTTGSSATSTSARPHPPSGHTFVRIAGDDRVYHAPTISASASQSGLDDLRDKTVLSFKRPGHHRGAHHLGQHGGDLHPRQGPRPGRPGAGGGQSLEGPCWRHGECSPPERAARGPFRPHVRKIHPRPRQGELRPPRLLHHPHGR